MLHWSFPLHPTDQPSLLVLPIEPPRTSAYVFMGCIAIHTHGVRTFFASRAPSTGRGRTTSSEQSPPVAVVCPVLLAMAGLSAAELRAALAAAEAAEAATAMQAADSDSQSWHFKIDIVHACNISVYGQAGRQAPRPPAPPAPGPLLTRWGGVRRHDAEVVKIC